MPASTCPYRPSTHAHTIRLLNQVPLPTTTTNPHHQKLQTQLSTLHNSINNTQGRLTSTLSTLTSISPIPPQAVPPLDSQLQLQVNHAEAILARHIRLLHQYNAIKDIGLGLMGLIADKEGKRLKDVMEERGVGEKD